MEEIKRWTIEVKCREPVKITPPDGMALHLTQASFEDSITDVMLGVKFGGKSWLLAQLSGANSSIDLNLVFHQGVTISRDSGGGIAKISGYMIGIEAGDEERIELVELDDEELSSDDEDEGAKVETPKRKKKTRGGKDVKKSMMKRAVPVFTEGIYSFHCKAWRKPFHTLEAFDIHKAVHTSCPGRETLY